MAPRNTSSRKRPKSAMLFVCATLAATCVLGSDVGNDKNNRGNNGDFPSPPPEEMREDNNAPELPPEPPEANSGQSDDERQGPPPEMNNASGTNRGKRRGPPPDMDDTDGFGHGKRQVRSQMDERRGEKGTRPQRRKGKQSDREERE